jgi:ribonuclease III
LILKGFLKAQFSQDRDLSRKVKNILGFYPENIFLYKLAFLHKSAAQSAQNGAKLNNERLEYLGDAVLSSVIADYLFKKYPLNDEGFLTEMRSKIVSRANLNKLSQKLGLSSLIQRDKESNNYYRSIEGDAFEALVGAIYLDKGFRFTHKVIIERIINIHLDIDEMEHKEWNFKSKLIDWAQKEKKHISFDVIEVVGSGYNKQYVVQVFIDKIEYGKGRDYSIKAAEQMAAENSWKMIQSPEQDATGIA